MPGELATCELAQVENGQKILFIFGPEGGNLRPGALMPLKKLAVLKLTWTCIMRTETVLML